MTNREIVWGAAALFVGLFGAVGVVLFVRHPHAPVPVATSSADASADDAAVVPLAPVDPEPDFSEGDAAAPPPDHPSPPPHPREAGAKAAESSRRGVATSSVVRATNLEIHPDGNDTLCVDISTRGYGVQLFPCHGRKNQRWTFAEDSSGVMSVFGKGGCLRSGGTQPSGAVELEVGACEGSARFRHLDDKRFRDVSSGQCITARPVKKHARLVLEACDFGSAGQTWSLSH